MPNEKSIRTIVDLRDNLLDQLDKLRAGTITASHATAVAAVSGKVLFSIKLELEYCKLIGAVPNIAALSIGEVQPPLALVSLEKSVKIKG
jgi:hypothetical protein